MAEDTKNKNDTAELGGAVLIGAGIGVIVTTLALQSCLIEPLKARAVELGAAEWVVNPKDGSIKFQWKEKK